MKDRHKTQTHVSPSQINTFSRCPRKWAYSRTSSRHETAATKFGTKVHTILEGWLLERTLPSPNTPEGRCALAGLPHLPMPKSAGLSIEENLLMFYYEIKYVGRIDFVVVTDTCVTIGDHKTTKDLSYAKSAEELLDDPQRIIYSHWAAETYDRPKVSAKWVYYQRKPCKSITAELEEGREQIAERFHKLHTRYSLPIVRANPEDPTTLARNFDACSDFGRCPYQEQCNADDAKPEINNLDFFG